MVGRAHFVVCGFSFLLAITAAPVGADPIRVTGGSAFMDDIPIQRSVDLRLELGTLDVSVHAGGDPEKRRIFFPAPPPQFLENGQVADLSSRLILPTPQPSMTLPDLFFAVDFTFNALPSVLTQCSDGGGCTASSRFSFFGTLLATDSAGNRLLDSEVIGSGEASAFFQSFSGPGAEFDQGRLRFVSYRFDPVPDSAPVPEPSTILLLATGSALIGRAARRRRANATDRAAD